MAGFFTIVEHFKVSHTQMGNTRDSPVVTITYLGRSDRMEAGCLNV